MDDAHHGSSHADIDGLSHCRQEVLLDLEAPLPDAPAAVHQEDQVDFTLCTDISHVSLKTRVKRKQTVLKGKPDTGQR